MPHKHSVYDGDTHFKIRPVTRQIENTSEKVVLMQNDHNSERFTFEIPRTVDGHDMSQCNVVEVHYINIDGKDKSANNGIYPVEDLQLAPDAENVVICSWLISQNATKYAGTLNFVLRFACLTGEIIDYQWFTDIHKGISVSESISNTAAVIEDYADILAEWEDRIAALEQGGGNIKLDTTLTKEGMAADARAVGDALAKSLVYTHAVPTSLSMVNAIKRARQLTDVEWTPKGTIPGKKKINGVYEDYPFMEGQTYKGVPYEGGVASSYTYVGLNVDLDTFFSAVQNPNSILYTYDNKHTKGGAYYGTVCSKFAQYALNIPASMNTANVPNIEGLETIASKGAYNEYDVKLCDIMVDTSYHTVIVTDILYDSFGRVAFIEISEAVTPTCRRLLWTPDEFNTQWVPDYQLCRYKHINDIPYTKKEYVNIESENAEIAVSEPALMPQYGDKKNNKQKNGGTMPVHILKDGYTKAVVLRDGEIISETDITNATEFTYPLGTVGHIEMYLVDADGNESEHRYAQVCQATIEVTDGSKYDSGELSVKYTGSSGKPIYVQFNGMSEFCRLDGLGRSTIVDENNAVLSFNVKRAAKSVRVAYQNEYGTYYSEYADVVVTEPEPDVEIEPGENTSTDAYLSKGVFYDNCKLTEESNTPVACDTQIEICWVYTKIPVEANTTYYVDGATRIWFFDYTGAPIGTVDALAHEPQCEITTPDLAMYMSVTYDVMTMDKGMESVDRIGATDAATDMLLSETGATLVDNKNLNAGTYKQDTNADYFSYIAIPVEEGASYYTRGATRVWLLDENKASTGRTGNALSTWKKVGRIDVTAKEGAPEVKYISIAYSKAQLAAADMVRIRKLM